jgi:hypothetical protein
MHRLLSAVLFLCIGVLASLQAAPLQRCLMQNQIILSGAGHCAGDIKSCCETCGHDKNSPQSASEDCCVDLGKLSDATAPAHLERVADPVLVVALLFFVPDTWELMMRPVVIQQDYPPVPLKSPPAPSRRQAVLNVWTV